MPEATGICPHRACTINKLASPQTHAGKPAIYLRKVVTKYIGLFAKVGYYGGQKPGAKR